MCEARCWLGGLAEWLVLKGSASVLLLVMEPFEGFIRYNVCEKCGE